MNKNVVIFILVVFTIIGSIWGSVANKKRMSTDKKLSDTVAEVQRLTAMNSKEREQILGKTAGLQENLAVKEEQLQKARKELIDLRKSSQSLESKLSGCNASLQIANKKSTTPSKELQAANKKNTTLSKELQAANKKNTTLSKELQAANKKSTTPSKELQAAKDEIAELKTAARKQAEKITSTAAKEPVVAAAKKEDLAAAKQAAEQIRVLAEQVQSAEVTFEHIQQSLNAANAQIIGLEKIIDEKNAAMDETAQEMDRLKINMDVLLSKVAEQQDEIQEIQEENRELVKELAAKNEEIADLQEEIMQKPVQQ